MILVGKSFLPLILSFPSSLHSSGYTLEIEIKTSCKISFFGWHLFPPPLSPFFFFFSLFFPLPASRRVARRQKEVEKIGLLWGGFPFPLPPPGRTSGPVLRPDLSLTAPLSIKPPSLFPLFLFLHLPSFFPYPHPKFLLPSPSLTPPLSHKSSLFPIPAPTPLPRIPIPANLRLNTLSPLYPPTNPTFTLSPSSPSTLYPCPPPTYLLLLQSPRFSFFLFPIFRRLSISTFSFFLCTWLPGLLVGVPEEAFSSVRCPFSSFSLFLLLFAILGGTPFPLLLEKRHSTGKKRRNEEKGWWRS